MEYKLLSSLFYSNKELYEKIYENRKNSESTYNLNFKIGNSDAFVFINNDILNRIDKILELDKKLLFLTNNIPSIALSEYSRKCLIDEIKTTNDIEGISSTRREINDILNDKNNKSKNKRLYGIVKKYEMLIKDESIKLNKCEDIRLLYNELTLKDVVDENKENEPDGKIFRKDIVYVRNDRQEIIHRGITPEDEIINVMSNSLDILNNDDYNFLVRIAVFHYMFGYIHPFYDGNGRTSRFISSYLISKKLEPLVSYRLSYTIRQNIKKYYKSFNIVNDKKNRGDLTSFVITFFDFIIESIKDLCSSLIERIEKLDFFFEIIDKFTTDDKLKDIIFILVQNSLFGEEGLGVFELSNILEIGESTTRKLLKILENKELILKDKLGNKHIYNIHLDKLIDLGNDFK